MTVGLGTFTVQSPVHVKQQITIDGPDKALVDIQVWFPPTREGITESVLLLDELWEEARNRLTSLLGDEE